MILGEMERSTVTNSLLFSGGIAFILPILYKSHGDPGYVPLESIVAVLHEYIHAED